MGSALYYILAVSLYRMFERPYVLSGIGILTGYLKAMVSGDKRFDNGEYLKFFRRFERSALLRGKKRTIEKYDEQVRNQFQPPDKRKL